MKKIMTVMGAMMTGCAMAVVPGAWNTNFTNSLACAEKHNIPIVVVWGNMSCSHCTSLHNVLNDDAIMEWAKVHPIIMVDRYEEWQQKIEDYSPDHQAAYYWIKGIDSSLSVLPKVGVYWKKADGTVMCSQAFAGRDGSMPATSGTLAQQLANSLNLLVGEYVPLPEGGPYTETVDGIEWTFMVDANLNASVGTGEWGGTAVPTSTTGDIAIPAVLGERAVTGLRLNAFQSCTGLTSVTMPEGITSIGIWAFSGCSGLTSVTIPSSVTSIGTWAFSGCSGLTSINVAAENTRYSSQEGVLFDKNATTLVSCPCGKEGAYVIPSSVTSIGDSAFSGCSGLTSVTIPSSVTTIGDWAFSGCESLTSVTIPSSVTNMGDYAFSSCTGLTNVSISEGVTSVGNWAFQSCSSLPSVTIPASVTNLGYGTFQYCDALTAINVADGSAHYSSQDGVVFNKDATTLVQYPYGIKGGYTIPSSVTSIEKAAFYDCSELTSVTIPSSVTNIGAEAFMGCTGLGEGVVIVDRCVLTVNGECPSSVAFPKGTRLIAGSAFSDCSDLETVTIPSSVTSIGMGAFSGGWVSSVLQHIEVDPDNAYYSSQDGVLFNKDKTLLIQYPGSKQGAYEIPSGVTSIGPQAFAYCGLASVIIPSGVTTIGDSAFMYCYGLTSVTIPSSVTTIGGSAFMSCYGLTSVMIPSSVTNIGDSAFCDCGSLTSVIIPSGVTSIGDSAFMSCNFLTSVTIPSSVTSIGKAAFAYCDNMRAVDFEGAPPKGVTSAEITQDAAIRYNVAYEAQWLPVIEQCGWTNAQPYTPGDPRPAGGPYAEVVAGVVWTFMVDTNLNASVGRDDGAGSAVPQSTTGALVIPATLGGRTVTTIRDDAFPGCSGLTSVTIPSSVTSIGYYAFWNCTGLTGVTIPSSVTSIGGWAFCNCIGLPSMTIPSSVTSIGGSAFYGCDNMDAVDFEGAPPEGVVAAEIKQDAAIRYNVAYQEQWLPVIEQCGWTNATPYVPIPERGIVISFVAPNGESSMERAYFATNRPYGRLPLARREGCTFAGWYTSLDGTERVGAFDEVLPDVKTLYARWAEDEAPLYAQWDPNHYSAVFNPDGGTGEMEAQPFIYDQRQALTANAFKKTGYTFKGWATNEAGEVVYADQQVVSNLTAEAGFAVALFAKWEQIMDITKEEIEEWVAYDLAPTYKKPGETKTGYVKRFKERFGDDYTKAFYSETGKIGQDGTALCVYHDYIAGTDPLDKDSQFTASIEFDESGKPVVTYDPVLDEEKAALRVYTTYGKANLTDKDWSVVQPGQEADYRFFKVTIEMLPKN